jgi:hypothetical protein
MSDIYLNWCLNCEQAAAEERERIVAWLRKAGYRQLADAIEAGKHL